MTPATTMSGAVAARTESSSPPVPRRSARSARSRPLKVLMPSAGGLLLLELSVVLSVVMRRPSFGREWWSGGLIGGGSGGPAGSRSGRGDRGGGRAGGGGGGRTAAGQGGRRAGGGA